MLANIAVEAGKREFEGGVVGLLLSHLVRFLPIVRL